MKDALKDGSLLDHGVLLEYELPLSSLRLDCMVLGHDSAKMHPNAVVMELKQWEKVDPSEAENCVRTWVAGAHRDVEHPSMQAFSYADYLRNMHTAFADDRVILSSCAYLHNFTYDANDEIYDKKFTEVLGLAQALRVISKSSSSGICGTAWMRVTGCLCLMSFGTASSGQARS
jgi:uncharacterized protein